jgi:transketolase
MYKKANAGHIGTSLSCLDILLYLFLYKMTPVDKFILSKGHAAAGLYAVLAEAGRIDKSLLDTFYKDGTNLAAHPPCNGAIKDIPFGTGSLGHGLSLAAGMAFSTKFSKKKFKVYCVISDGDCNEGSTWEAALFAAQHKLDNLIVIVDKNNLQGFGKTKDVINLDPLYKKWEAFNFDVVTASNGNDFLSLEKAFNKMKLKKSKKPKCIVANTTKGSGVSFMENKMEWHYLPMNDKQYKKALKENGLKDA